jgi:hypothetical protein
MLAQDLHNLLAQVASLYKTIAATRPPAATMNA